MEEPAQNAPNNVARGTDKPLVIVTGSSGLIGSNVIRQLSQHYRFVGMDQEGAPYPPDEAECITMDVSDQTSIGKALEQVRLGYGNRIASVVHLAVYYDFSGEPSDLYEKVTIEGTRKLLEALQNFEVEQFIFASSNLIYKPTEPGQKIHEDCPLEGNWDYPDSKIITEQVIHEHRGRIPAVLLRIAGVYNERGHSIPISHQIQRIYEKDLTSHFFSGDVTHGNVFVHLNDVVGAIRLAIHHRHSMPEEIPINIGEPVTPTYEELQDRIGELVHGREWRTYEIPKPLAKVGARMMNLFGDSFIKPWMIDRADEHYELDISRAGHLLGWEPRHDLMSTLPKMVEHLLADPEGWYRENKLK